MQASKKSLSRAAGTWRDRVAVRAGLRMAKEAANAFVEFGADDVFELAGLGVSFGVGDGEGVREESFGEATTANHVAGAALAGFGEIHFGIAHCDKAKDGQALERALGIGVERVEAGELGSLAGLGAEPKLFENMIETSFVFRGVNRDLSEAAVSELDTAVGEAAHGRIVRDH